MEIEQISEGLKQSFKLFVDGLAGYSESQFEHKQSQHIWSLGQMYQHLYGSATNFFLANINRCLEKRKGAFDQEPNQAGKFVLAQNGFPNQKFKRPVSEDSPEPISQGLEFYQNHFAALLDQFLRLAADLAADNGQYRTQHPVLGFLNAKEWYQNMEIHLRHHLLQKEELESY